MYGHLHIAVLLSYFFLACIGVWRFKALSLQSKSVVWMSVVIVFGDAFSILLSFLRIASYKYAVFTLFIISLLLLRLCGRGMIRKSYRRVSQALIAVALLFSATTLILPMPYNEWPSYTFLVYQVVWVIVPVLALLDQLENEDPSPLWRRAYFWFMASHFCFYCFSFLLFPLRSVSVQGMWSSQIHNELILWACVFLYGAMIIGIVLDKTQSKVPHVE